MVDKIISSVVIPFHPENYLGIISGSTVKFRDHFGVNFRMISGLWTISGAVHNRAQTSVTKLSFQYNLVLPFIVFRQKISKFRLCFVVLHVLSSSVIYPFYP